MRKEPESWTPENIDNAERSGFIYRVRGKYFYTSNSHPVAITIIPPARPASSSTPPNLGEPLSEQPTSTPTLSAPRTPARDIPFPHQLATLKRMSRNGTPAVESSVKLGPLPEPEKVGGSA